MEKTKKKKTTKANQKKSVSMDLKVVIQRRAESLFALSFRLQKMIDIYKKDNLPDEAKLYIANSEQILLNMKEITAKKRSSGTEGNAFNECSDLILEALAFDIADKKCLEALKDACYSLSVFYLCRVPDIERRDLLAFHNYESYLTNRSHEAIGYWMAESKENKIRQDNANAKTRKKEYNKETIKNWRKTMTPDDCRLKAIKELGIKDRTYLRYIQEITEEKNVKIRNAKPTVVRKTDESAKSS